MVQREVADRICAKPEVATTNALRHAQLYSRVENLFTLLGSVLTAAKVNSTVLRLTLEPQQEKLGVVGDGFIDSAASFGQKRKTLLE